MFRDHFLLNQLLPARWLLDQLLQYYSSGARPGAPGERRRRRGQDE